MRLYCNHEEEAASISDEEMVDGDANIDDKEMVEAIIDDEEMVDANIGDEDEEMVDANIDDEDEEMVDANIKDEEMGTFPNRYNSVLFEWLRKKLGDSGRACSLYSVLSPTRELAQQIADDLCEAGKSCGMKSICLYGGSSKGQHIQGLKSMLHKSSTRWCYLALIEIFVGSLSHLSWHWPKSTTETRRSPAIRKTMDLQSSLPSIVSKLEALNSRQWKPSPSSTDYEGKF
ncbi:hypothetical protein Sjap_022113 [Stephania japonica]|uniref:DEAD/DEAH-box helicase domain-containing protein n=1 Tax=Stephania japonica TaxID=461633 RepID=A0AAP0HU44_9MAGN